MVRSGRWTRAEADAKLRPWNAVAVLCWASVFAGPISECRHPIVFYCGDGSPGDYSHQLGEAEARADVARDLCPRAEWEPVLSQAAAAAIDAYEANRGKQTEQAARDLLAVCRALDVMPAATRLRVPQPERIAA